MSSRVRLCGTVIANHTRIYLSVCTYRYSPTIQKEETKRKEEEEEVVVLTD